MTKARYRWLGWNLNQYADPATVGRCTNAVKTFGSKWVRLDAVWRYCAPTPGTDDWSWIDARLTPILASGRRPLFMVAGWNPGWTARPAPPDHFFSSSPAVIAEYGAWVGRLVARYRDRVKRWELGNEPNLNGFSTSGVDAMVQSKYVLAAAHAIRSQPHDGLISTPGLANASNDHGNRAPWDYFNELWPQVSSVVDRVGMHVYQHAKDDGQSWAPTTALRKMIGLAGAGAWITECNTDFDDAPTARAAGAGPLLDLLESIGGVELVQWYKVEGDDAGFESGALDNAFKPRPVYDALAKWASS